jgi:hypothetical protein
MKVCGVGSAKNKNSSYLLSFANFLFSNYVRLNHILLRVFWGPP